MLTHPHPRPPRHARAHRHGEGARRTATTTRHHDIGLRGAACSARRPRSDRARQQTADQPIAVRKPQAKRRRRGYRHQVAARAQGAVQKLIAGKWIERHQNLLIIGPTGVGKSWIACAGGHKAYRDNHSVLYQRLPRVFDALAPARGDGHHPRFLKSWLASSF